MKFSLKFFAQNLLLFVLCLTPIFCVFEVIALFQGALQSQSEALTPAAIKVIRDLVWVSVIVVAAVRMVFVRRISVHWFFFAALLLITIYGAVVSATISPILAAAGLRWMLPVFLAFFLIGIADDIFLVRASKVMSVLLIVQILIQIAEFFYGSTWFGVNKFGFASRSPGFFLIPNTAALFAILCFFLTQFYSSNEVVKRLVSVLSFTSIVLTASGTGIVVFLVAFMLCKFGRKHLKVKLLAVLVFGSLSFPFLMTLTGRGDDYVDISLGTRVSIFFDSVRDGGFFPEYFGLGTNTGVLIKDSLPVSVAAKILDSTYASIVVNFGVLGLLLFGISLLVWIYCALVLNKLELYVFTLIFMAFGMTTIIPESYPANLLFAAFMAKYLDSYIKIRLTGPRMACDTKDPRLALQVDRLHARPTQ